MLQMGLHPLAPQIVYQGRGCKLGGRVMGSGCEAKDAGLCCLFKVLGKVLGANFMQGEGI